MALISKTDPITGKKTYYESTTGQVVTPGAAAGFIGGGAPVTPMSTGAQIGFNAQQNYSTPTTQTPTTPPFLVDQSMITGQQTAPVTPPFLVDQAPQPMSPGAQLGFDMQQAAITSPNTGITAGIPSWQTYNPDPTQGTYTGATGSIYDQPQGVVPGAGGSAPQYGPFVDQSGGATVLPNQAAPNRSGYENWLAQLNSSGDKYGAAMTVGQVSPTWLSEAKRLGIIDDYTFNTLMRDMWGVPYDTGYRSPAVQEPVGGGLPPDLAPVTPPAPAAPVTPTTPTEPVTPPAPAATSGDQYWQMLLDAIGAMGQNVQGTNEPYTPSTAVSELSQALQNTALEELNRPYGYTPEEEAAIYQRQMNRFNEGLDADTQMLEALYQKYGWNQSGTELGGQGASSMQDYFGKRALAQSDLAGQITEQMANARFTDRNAAISNALSTNSQLYEQVRGDFADQLALMGFNEQVSNQDFNEAVTLAQFESEEAQRNFLNQQGITDRQTQDYYLALTTAWQQQMDAQGLADTGLTNWANYTAQQQEVSPSDILSSSTWYDNFLSNLYGQGVENWNDQPDTQNLFLTALMTSMMGGNQGAGTTTNVTTPATDMSWMTDLIKTLGGGAVGALGNIDWSKIDIGNPLSWPADIVKALFNMPTVGASVTFGGKTYRVGSQGTLEAATGGGTTTGGTTDPGLSETTTGGLPPGTTPVATDDMKLADTLGTAFNTAVIGGIVYGIIRSSQEYKEAVLSEGGQARRLVKNTIGYENPVIGYAVGEMYKDYPELMKTSQSAYILSDVINAMNSAMTAKTGQQNEIYNRLMENIVDKITVREAVGKSQYDLLNDPKYKTFQDALNAGDYHTAAMSVPDINRNDPNSDAWKIAGIARWTIKEAVKGNKDVLTFGK